MSRFSLSGGAGAAGSVVVRVIKPDARKEISKSGSGATGGALCGPAARERSKEAGCVARSPASRSLDIDMGHPVRLVRVLALRAAEYDRGLTRVVIGCDFSASAMWSVLFASGRERYDRGATLGMHGEVRGNLCRK